MTTVAELTDWLREYAATDPAEWAGEWPAEFASVGTALHPESTERLMLYWSTGVGGTTKIRWAEPCPFCRCVHHLTKYYPKNPKGLCAHLEERALGHRPNVENSHTRHCPPC